jgi:predicted ATPase
MNFKKISRGSWGSNSDPDTVYLEIDHWNDYSFVTMFDLYYRDSDGDRLDIGAVKIGFKGQTVENSTHSTLASEFPHLGNEYFSLGQDIQFYRNIAKLPSDVADQILESLRDIVSHPDIIDEIRDERVFSVSLLRDVTLSEIRGQYVRALMGSVELTDFNFRFFRPETETLGDISLNFMVSVGSTPSTNIHAVIGRNGVGKTTLLNGMIDAITNRPNLAKFINLQSSEENEIGGEYFSSLVSVSFSAFDPFNPPAEQSDPSKGTCYFYVGLKDADDPDRHRTIQDLRADCIRALAGCFRSEAKSRRWVKAIDKLGSDENFALMELTQLRSAYQKVAEQRDSEQSDSTSFLEQYAEAVDDYLSRMSSGHAIVLLTITRLVEKVQEKTLVLMDEPESHLHPPLLSAFVRALADLLHDQNGVAIIATHSPVVLQEIPKSCVWKIHRRRKDVSAARPTIETFAENVGLLTSEVFRLEVARSGFHALLDASVNNGASFEQILHQYRDQLGFEGRAILAALIAERGAGATQ